MPPRAPARPGDDPGVSDPPPRLLALRAGGALVFRPHDEDGLIGLRHKVHAGRAEPELCVPSWAIDRQEELLGGDREPAGTPPEGIAVSPSARPGAATSLTGSRSTAGYATCAPPSPWWTDADGRPLRVLGSVQDVTEQRRAEQEIAAHVAVSGALDVWDDLETGARRLLEGLAEALDAAGGVLWAPEGEYLVARVVWRDPTVDAEPFWAATRDARLRRGVGVAGTA